MRNIRLTVALAVVLALSACATYRYGDRTFSDRNEAELAQKAQLEQIAKEFQPRNKPLAKYAKVIMLSKALILDRSLRPGGNNEGRDYVATILYNDYRNTGEIIRKRNIFERVDIEESSDGVHVSPKPGEVVIYLYHPDSKTMGWYYISNTTKRTPLHFDKGNPDIVGQVKYFIDSIEALASGEQVR